MSRAPASSEDTGDESTLSRPYRSHKIPACDFCHRRKSRCHRDRLNEPCSLCRIHHHECTTRPASQARRQPPRSKRQTDLQPRPSYPPTPVAAGVSTAGSHDDTPGLGRVDMAPADAEPGLSSHIVGPAVAHDVQMLERYISPKDTGPVGHVHPNPYSVYSDDPRNPVVYLKVPRQRSTVSSGNGTSGFKQCEILDNILGSLGPHLFELYFDVIHPSFPILDERAVTKAYKEGTLPHTLVCEIYAVSLVYWGLSPKVAATKRDPPDIRYVWNLTVRAMHDDFHSPSFSTVLACILDLLGRPITSITYNAINIGSAVALAQSFGLNRNPANWKLDPRQKNLRIKTWWALLIHDYWASLCHGTPSHIHRDQFDVDLPDLDTVLDGVSPNNAVYAVRLKGAHSFIGLCRLTRLLGEVLSVIYSLRPDPLEQTLKVLRRVEAHVDEWQDSLPDWLNPSHDAFERNQPGSLNLRLSYLALKICICRAALQATRVVDDEEAQYYQGRCIKTGNSLIEFAASIKLSETKAFWLPHTAYHFASAATLMMRCALDAHTPSVANACLKSAQRLLDHLDKMKKEAGWDLGDICLNQCQTTMKQMSDDGNLELWRRKNHERRLHVGQNADQTGEADLADREPSSGNEPVLQSEDAPGQDATMEDWFEGTMDNYYFPELWQVSHF